MCRWGGCQDLQCTKDWFHSTYTHNKQWNMINAAASDKEGYVFFNSGNYENVGTGSLMKNQKGGLLDVEYAALVAASANMTL